MKNSFIYRTVFTVVIVTIVVKVVLVDIYKVPTGSMENTLLKGDRILVLKVFNYKPNFNKRKGRFIRGLNKPHRNDVIIFLHPDENKTYVKRCIGLPMDSILLIDNEIFINKQRCARPVKARLRNPDSSSRVSNNHISTYIDSFHERERDSVVVHIPEQQYYMLGDNTNGSYDSRYWGAVNEKNIIGKAKFILFNFKNGKFQKDRFLKAIE